MKLHRGSISPIGEQPKAEIAKKKKFFGKITPVLQVALGDIQIKCINAMNGTVYNQTPTFGGSVKGLDARYIFLSATSKFLAKCIAVLGTAPATEMEVDNKAYMVTDSPLIRKPGREMTVDAHVASSKYARLVAYARASLVHIKNVIVSRYAKLVAAPGAVAKYRKKLRLKSTYKAEAADSAIAHSRKTVATGIEAAGCSAPVVDSVADTAFIAESTVIVNPAAAADMSGHVESGTQHSVIMSRWFYPEEVGDGLIIRQVYHAEESEEGLVLN